MLLAHSDWECRRMMGDVRATGGLVERTQIKN
jgi:hypothetical protein